MMDHNSPEGVLDTPQSSYENTKALIPEWHGKGRQNYAITPRFAITSLPEKMEMIGQLARRSINPPCSILVNVLAHRWLFYIEGWPALTASAYLRPIAPEVS